VKLTGGIATVADGVLKTTTVRLVEYGLERWPTACGDVRGAPVCVTGGIGP